MVTNTRANRGFSLTELMLVVAVLGTIAAIAAPVLTDVTGSIKLSQAARTVERELQDARLRAVSSNRILRVRTNCPTPGTIRTVEVLNTSADNASNRCDVRVYPFPAADDDVVTRPNYDGPVRLLPESAVVGTHVIEFQPNGTARIVVSNTATTITTPIAVAVTRKSVSKTITVNGAGKIQLQ